MYAASAANVSTTPLMSTKARFDQVTRAWIWGYALSNLTAPQNIIIMNDFIDGATTHLAYRLSEARFAGNETPAGAYNPIPVGPGPQRPQPRSAPGVTSLAEAQSQKSLQDAALADLTEKIALIQNILTTQMSLVSAKGPDATDADRAGITNLQDVLRDLVGTALPNQRQAVSVAESLVEELSK